MKSKSTGDLENILTHTHPDQFNKFMEDNSDELVAGDKDFSQYMHDIIMAKGLQQQDIFINADIPERYGYKLLSEQKRTRKRDVILRICYACNMTVEETNRALKLYGMSPLYPRNSRDALVTVFFNEHTGCIIDLSELLIAHGFDPLMTCGSNE